MLVILKTALGSFIGALIGLYLGGRWDNTFQEAKLKALEFRIKQSIRKDIRMEEER